ncbi:MAG: hypothetical protein CBC05_02970 [Crocinitomicaceae bacterium TMED45]|nr:MAG: hypothetical protein CBC05_02970 [Crocinitomicaceae bacterium TMED45]
MPLLNTSKMATQQTKRQELITELRTILGDGMVDVELDPKHFDTAIDLSVDRFRQRSSNSTEESYIYLKILQDTNEYTLPKEVIEVREIFRRSVAGSNNSIDLDPFELAYTNLYFLQGGRIGGLMTWDAFAQYQEVVRRLFGGYLNFKYITESNKLILMRRPRAEETVLLQVYMEKPVDTLITQRYSRPWIRDYALAQCKMMLGEARSKYSSLPGAQGSVTLNGDALKAEAQATMERLEREIDTYGTGEDPLTFVIG